ncbi:hypothetical protein AAVH_17151 [Aphelenchoides avenae]|nr:hypothetical protein AAVH_17151 [Aphelenchus avenae]
MLVSICGDVSANRDEDEPVEFDFTHCASTECVSMQPEYRTFFQLDMRADLAPTCEDGVIICMPGLINVPRVMKNPENWHIEAAPWAQEACYDHNFTRAVRISANIREWTIEAGHTVFMKSGAAMSPIPSKMSVKRTSWGTFYFTNKLMAKHENNEPVHSDPAFKRTYSNYLYDSFSECADADGGYIVPQARRIVGSLGCRMSVKIAGPSLKPYSVDGALCEFGWTELYQCNNGGGLQAANPNEARMGQATESVVTCQVKVETGLTDSKGSTKSKKDSSVKTAEKQKTTDVDKTTTVDKNFRMYFEESASFGFEIPVVKDIFSAGFKVTQSFAIDKNTQNTVQDQVKPLACT